MNKPRLILGILRLPLDFILAFSALILAYYLRPLTDLIPGVQYPFVTDILPLFQDYVSFSLLASTFLVILFVFNGLYKLHDSSGHAKLAGKILFWVSAWLMFIIAYYALVVHELFFSRIALVHIWGFTFIFIFLGRELLHCVEFVLLRWGIGQIRVLLVGVNRFTQICYDQLKKDKQYKPIGTLSEKNLIKNNTSVKVLGYYNQFKSILRSFDVNAVIQTDPEMKKEDVFDLLYYCRSHRIEYYMAPDALGLQQANMSMEILDELPLIHLKHTPLEGWGYVLKRGFDVLVALLVILILIPFWFIIGLLIKLDSKGPVFYKSKRKYRDKIFHIYKFRSMVSEAEAMKKSLMAQNERKGILFKMKNDPRVTRLGRFLRKTSLDEFPQILNVLKGEMSLVGPRPHLPEEVDQYEKHHHQVFTIKPGITGLAQVNGRSNLDFEEEVKLDIYYIENWSLWLDIKLLLKTVGVIFKANGV